jgi:hypothetical protein
VRKSGPITVRIFFEMLGGAGLALAEAAESDKPRVRDECAELMRSILTGLRQLAA